MLEREDGMEPSERIAAGIVELKVEPLQTSREALTAASVSAEKAVDDLGQNV